MTKKLTKSGVKAALNQMGYNSKKDIPPALQPIKSSTSFTDNEMDFALYLIHDTDFGGAWNDETQINFHLA